MGTTVLLRHPHCKGMKQGVVLVLFLGFCFLVCADAQANSCYAAPMTKGPTCTGHRALDGVDGMKRVYKVDVRQASDFSTLVCCNALGCNAGNQKTCKPGLFQWYHIGCGYGKFDGVVLWGANFAKPALECWGNPTGVFYSYDI